jgi:TM2 domain-containing membrane protein YozV/predicted Ser/Thr protein kinase
MDTKRTCPSCQKPLPPDVPLGLCPECLIKAGFNTGVASGGGNPGFIPPPVGEIAKLFPQLEIIEFIGKGGMGAVYKARQPALDRFVALKILPLRVAGAPGFAERFNREARALARLVHPNIVAVHDFGQAGELHYLVMEFVEGANLREVERAGQLAPEQALAIVPQICEALQFAHNEGIVHRDIKPENVLMDKKGRVKITDFGIAKILGRISDQAFLTGAKDVVGTPHYMAPEQIERPTLVDHRADIYSLGVVFYEMLTGELPLGKFAPPSKKFQLDVRLDEVVLHTLEKEPDRRYQQASQVKTDVETIASGKPGAMPSSTVPPIATAVVTSDKTILPAFLLAFFFGVFGAHRFYVGKTKTAILQLAALVGCILLIIACATLSAVRVEAGILLGALICGCGIWATIDWVLILCRSFTDGQGRRINQWIHPDPSKSKSGGGGTSSPSTVTPGDRRAMIVAPAVGLMIAGALKLASALPAFGWLGAIFENFGINFPFHAGHLVGFGVVVFKLIPALLILFGAIQMMQIRSYAWVMAAAILAIICFSLVGFIVGIWSLVILARPEVREAFVHPPDSQSPATAKWSWLLGIFGLLTLLIILALGFSNHGLAKSRRDSDRDPWPDIAGTNLVDKTTASETTTPGSEKDPPAGKNPTDQKIEVGDLTNFSKSLPVEPDGGLTMNVDRGDVRVTGSDQNMVEVQVDREVTGADDAEAAKILEDEHLVLKQTGHQISITADDPLGLQAHSFWEWLFWLGRRNLNVHYTITVPRKFAARLEASGGSVKVASLDGNVEVRTAGGGLDFNDIDGNVTGQTAGGGIHAISCKNELLVQTAGGSIRIERFTGPRVRAMTEGGSISADFDAAPKADCELHTMGGSVTVRLPFTAAVTLDAHTLGGTVMSDLPVQSEGQFNGGTLKGKINGGGPLLKLETMGGSIHVLQQ